MKPVRNQPATRMRAFLLAAWLVAGVTAGRAQDYLVDVWRTEEGLPHNTISCVAQTGDGYLWVGSFFGGLSRFNGHRFETFTSANTPELASSEIYQVMSGKDGTLWVSLIKGSLVSVRRGDFHSDWAVELVPQSWITELVLDEPGRKAFRTYEGTLLLRHSAGGSNRWEKVMPAGAGRQTHYHADGAGRIWCVQADGVYQLRGQSFERLPPAATAGIGTVRVLAVDSKGQLWAGTDRGLALWDGSRFGLLVDTTIGFLGDVRQIQPVSGGGLWVRFDGQLRLWLNGRWSVTAPSWSKQEERDYMPGQRMAGQMLDDGAGGVWCANPGRTLFHVLPDGTVHRLNERDGLPSLLISGMSRDAEGNVWLGLEEGGLVRLRPRLIRAYTPPLSGPPPMIYSVCGDRDGGLWLGGARQALWHLRQDQFAQVSLPAGWAGLQTVVTPSAKGGIWVATCLGGLWRSGRDGFELAMKSDAFGLAVRVMLEDKQGRLWIGNEHGLFMWADGRVQRFGPEQGFENVKVKLQPTTGEASAAGAVFRWEEPMVEALAEDGEGNLWIGLAQGELRRLSGGRFTVFRPPWAESWMRFGALLVDTDGSVWVGTDGGGLLRFRNGRFWRYTSRDGLVNDHIAQLLDDGAGNLWVGTPKGIARVAKSELHDFFEQRASQVACLSFGRSEGMPTLQCSSRFQPNCWRGQDGRLWFATAGGLAELRPERVRLNSRPPPVAIEEVRVDGVRQTLSNGPSGNSSDCDLRIGPGKHHLEFRFAGLSLAAPEKVRYRWRLEGIESGWVEGHDKNSVGYGLLPPGRYTFHVTACNNDGIWNEQGKKMTLVIAPFFWQTWSFRVVAFAGAIGLSLGGLLLALRRRHRRDLEQAAHAQAIATQKLEHQQELERERSRIAKDLHDDLGGSLTEINMLAAVTKSGALPPAATEENLSLIAHESNRIMCALDEIVWAVNPKHDSASSLAAYLTGTSREFLAAAGISLRLDVQRNLPTIPLSPECRHDLLLAVKESFNNVVRHSQATEAWLRFKVDAGRLRIAVEDNGRGFNPATAPTGGDGLENLRSRLAGVGGTCRIVSRPGGGTVVELEIPVA